MIYEITDFYKIKSNYKSLEIINKLIKICISYMCLFVITTICLGIYYGMNTQIPDWLFNIPYKLFFICGGVVLVLSVIKETIIDRITYKETKKQLKDLVERKVVIISG